MEVEHVAGEPLPNWNDAVGMRLVLLERGNLKSIVAGRPRNAPCPFDYIAEELITLTVGPTDRVDRMYADDAHPGRLLGLIPREVVDKREPAGSV
jgi:hypothetical protein